MTNNLSFITPLDCRKYSIRLRKLVVCTTQAFTTKVEAFQSNFNVQTRLSSDHNNKRFIVFFTLICSNAVMAGNIAPDEFNASYPPSVKVKAAFEQVNGIIPEQDLASKLFKARYNKLLESRSEACIKFRPKANTSFEEIKVLDSKLTTCIEEQDNQLIDLAGISSVGYLMKQPPLVPKGELGKENRISITDGFQPYEGAIATKANIAILRSTTNEHLIIELPIGEKISSLPTLPYASFGETKLSPNGRIAVIRNAGIVFYDTKTGKDIWKTKNIGRFYSWLPEINAALVGMSGSNLLLLDFDAAKITPSDVPDTNQSWIIHTNESPSRMLIGQNDTFLEVENKRESTKIKNQIIKNYKFKVSTADSSYPVLMQNGNSIFFWSFHTKEDNFFTLFNLRTGEERIIRHGKFLSSAFTKMNEQEVIVYSYDADSYCTPYALNAANSTITRIKTGSEFCWGILQNMRERTGMMGRNQDVWFGDQFTKIDNPLPLEKAVKQRQTELELTSIESNAGYSNSNYNQSADPDIAKKRAELLGPMPANASVQTIGVYQAKHNGVYRGVNVVVKKTNKPLILVLSSYSKVRWDLKNEAGSNLLAVIVLSYETSKIKGDVPAKTIIRKGKFAYEQNSPEFLALDHDVRLWTGKSISKFQGIYEGADFTVEN